MEAVEGLNEAEQFAQLVKYLGGKEVKLLPSDVMMSSDLTFNNESPSATGCWGALLRGPDLPVHCIPSFVIGKGHFKNKFCHVCRARGVEVPVDRIRQVTPACQMRNELRQGFWNVATNVGQYRLINQTADCQGPPLLVTLSRAPKSKELTAVPDDFVTDDATIRLMVSKGTLVPSLRTPQPLLDVVPPASEGLGGEGLGGDGLGGSANLLAPQLLTAEACGACSGTSSSFTTHHPLKRGFDSVSDSQQQDVAGSAARRVSSLDHAYVRGMGDSVFLDSSLSTSQGDCSRASSSHDGSSSPLSNSLNGGSDAAQMDAAQMEAAHQADMSYIHGLIDYTDQHPSAGGGWSAQHGEAAAHPRPSPRLTPDESPFEELRATLAKVRDLAVGVLHGPSRIRREHRMELEKHVSHYELQISQLSMWSADVVGAEVGGGEAGGDSAMRKTVEHAPPARSRQQTQQQASGGGGGGGGGSSSSHHGRAKRREGGQQHPSVQLNASLPAPFGVAAAAAASRSFTSGPPPQDYAAALAMPPIASALSAAALSAAALPTALPPAAAQALPPAAAHQRLPSPQSLAAHQSLASAPAMAAQAMAPAMAPHHAAHFLADQLASQLVGLPAGSAPMGLPAGSAPMATMAMQHQHQHQLPASKVMRGEADMSVSRALQQAAVQQAAVQAQVAAQQQVVAAQQQLFALQQAQQQAQQQAYSLPSSYGLSFDPSSVPTTTIPTTMPTTMPPVADLWDTAMRIPPSAPPSPPETPADQLAAADAADLATAAARPGSPGLRVEPPSPKTRSLAAEQRLHDEYLKLGGCPPSPQSVIMPFAPKLQSTWCGPTVNYLPVAMLVLVMAVINELMAERTNSMPGRIITLLMFVGACTWLLPLPRSEKLVYFTVQWTCAIFVFPLLFVIDDLSRSPAEIASRLETIPDIAPSMAVTYALIGLVHGAIPLASKINSVLFAVQCGLLTMRGVHLAYVTHQLFLPAFGIGLAILPSVFGYQVSGFVLDAIRDLTNKGRPIVMPIVTDCVQKIDQTVAQLEQKKAANARVV